MKLTLRTLLADFNTGLSAVNRKLRGTLLTGRTIEDALHIGQQQANFHAKGASAESRQRVVVRELVSLRVASVGRYGIVLVDDGDDAQAEEPIDGVLQVVDAALVLEVVLRDEDLRGRHLDLIEEGGVQVHHLELPGGRAGRVVVLGPLLPGVGQIGQLEEGDEGLGPDDAFAGPAGARDGGVAAAARHAVVVELPLVGLQLVERHGHPGLLAEDALAHADGAGRDEDDLDAVSGELGDLLGDGADPGQGGAAVLVGHHGRPGLDQDAAGAAKGAAGGGFRHLWRNK